MSIRVRLAGRDPSTFALGTDSARSIVDPRRFASMTGATGVRTIGGSGGTFHPHEMENAEITAKSAWDVLRDLCELCVVRRCLTECNGRGLRSCRYPRAFS